MGLIVTLKGLVLRAQSLLRRMDTLQTAFGVLGVRPTFAAGKPVELFKEHDTRPVRAQPVQSGLMPCSLTTLAHFSTSSRLASANCSGVFATGKAPTLAKRSRDSRDRMTLTNSSCRRLMMGRGVPAGEPGQQRAAAAQRSGGGLAVGRDPHLHGGDHVHDQCAGDQPGVRGDDSEQRGVQRRQHHRQHQRQ